MCEKSCMNLPLSSGKTLLVCTCVGLALAFFSIPSQAQSFRSHRRTLSASPTSLSFQSVNVGETKTLSLTLANWGRSAITVSRLSINNSAFTVSGLSVPLTLSRGTRAHVNVVFRPQAAGSISGNLVFTSNASNTALTVSLQGTGAGTAAPSLTASPSSLSFGTVQVGSSKGLSETLRNSGTSSVTITSASVTGTGFSVSGLTLPVTLAAGQSATFTAAYAPRSSGAASGTLTIASNARQVLVALTGTGGAVGQLAVSPATLSFGNVDVGTSKNLTGTLTASGAAITVSSAGTGSTEFTLSGISLPLTLTSGQSAQFTITFRPQNSGAASVSASYASNASNGTVRQALTGTGVANTPPPPPTHSVNLAWTASTSGVSGYNIYRATTSGGPYTKVSSTLVTGVSYTDNSVASGSTYFYVVTAVGTSGVESSFSNEVRSAIP